MKSENEDTGIQVQVPTAFLGAIKAEAKRLKLPPRELALAVVHDAMSRTTAESIAAVAVTLKRQKLQAELASLGKATAP